MNDKKYIDQEVWQEAPGIILDSTNSALATRNYHVKCDAKYCIAVIQGYHLWWCSAHHQPLAFCEKQKK